MVGPVREKFGLWRESSRGIKSRLHKDTKEPVLDRSDVRTSEVMDKIERGDFVQEQRLKRYPSIDIDFDRVYAGSIEGDLDEAQEILMRAGFRNGPLAYVEVTDEFGADDGSYWLHIITESGKFPYIENRAGFFRRIKDQVHVVVWRDDEREMVHFGAHREKSALLQPARHVGISEADASRGIRDLRNKIEDEFDKQLPRPLEQ